MTRDELIALHQDHITALTPPPPPPVYNARQTNVTVNDVVMNVGERIARVPVSLQEPAKQTVSCRIVTQNDTAKENADFVRFDKFVVWNKGEQHKIIEIPTKNDFTGKRFKLAAASPLGYDGAAIPPMTRATGFIYGPGATTSLPTPAVEQWSLALPPKPTGLSLVFEEKFQNFNATDSGLAADGVTPTWLSKLAGNERRQYNGEVGWYSDPVLNPGTQPWLVDTDGQFKLQAQYWPNGVPGAPVNAAGTPLWFYSCVNISTEKLFNTIGVGSYVEVGLQSTLKIGEWSAIWLLGNSNMIGSSYAPRLEADLFESFGGGTLSKYGTTYHWRNASNGHSQYGIKLDPLASAPYSVDLTQFNTWSFWWGEKDLIYYINDKPYMTVPNQTPLDYKAFLQITIGLGGSAGTPNNANFPTKMPVNFARVSKAV